MENGFEQYDILLEAITNYTSELEEINNKIEKIKLSKKDQERFNELMNNYTEDILLYEYIENNKSKYEEYPKLYKYIELFQKGIATNDELSYLVNYVASMKVI